VVIFFWRSLTFCPTPYQVGRNFTPYHTHPASNEKSNSRSGILELEDRSSQMSEAPLSSKISIYLKDFTPILAQKIPQVVQIVLLSSFQLCPTLLSSSVTTSQPAVNTKGTKYVPQDPQQPTATAPTPCSFDP